MKSSDIYKLLEAQQELFEVAMNPSNLKKLASAIEGAQVGMEFEMVVPDVRIDDEDRDPEEDYDYDERVSDIDDIVNFFDDGNYNSTRDLTNLRDELIDKFYDWQGEKIDELWRDEGEEYFSTWCYENISDDEVAEYLEKEEDLFGETVPTKEDWKKFIEENYEEQTSIYYKAREQFGEAKTDEGDFDEEEFLNDIGIRYMTDVSNNVRADITWPHWTYPENEGSVDIESIGEDFSEAIGKRVYASDSYHGARRGPNAYSLEPDSSIDYNDGEAGLEFISHPMPIDEMLEDLEKVKKWADDKGAYTNKSTGLHINVSVPNYSRDDLDFVKLAVLLGDQYVLGQFGRLSNGYAKSALEIIKEKAKNSEDVDRLLKQLKSNVEGIASKLLHGGRTDKFTSINTKDEYVEFRSAGGDWLNKNFDKIQDTMLRFVVALDAACDKEKYKKEYYKALYKTLKPQDPKSELSMFAKFMSGEITRSQYAATIEGARAERLSAKGIKILLPSEVDENDWDVTYDDGMKSETVYIQNTQTVNTEDKAFDAIKKFKPQWVRPDKIQYITIKPYKFDEKLNELKLYRYQYSWVTGSAVAHNKEEAEQIAKELAPQTFQLTNDVRIEITEEYATKREIQTMLEYQEQKLKYAEAWNNRPKIWSVYFNSNIPKLYVSATTKNNMLDVVSKIYPTIDISEMNISMQDSEPTEDSYQYYKDQQIQMVRDRKQLENSDIKVYKVYQVVDGSNIGGRYIAAKNEKEAKKIALLAYPSVYSNDTEFSIQPAPYNYSKDGIERLQQEQNALIKQNRNQAEPRMAPGENMYLVRNNDTGHEVRLAASTEQNARGRAIRNDPHNFTGGADISVTPLRPTPPDPVSNLTGRVGSARPAFSEPAAVRVSDVREYRVTNNDTGVSRIFAGVGVDDAINRARREYPAIFSMGVLDAIRVS